MQLTVHTDYAFRTLIALATIAPELTTVGELSERYDISANHLSKVVQRLSELGYVETLRGKAGGVRLAAAPSSIRVGDVVRLMEPELGLVECLRGGAPGACVISPACRLKSVLTTALDSFLHVLDGYTLADLVKNRGRVEKLLELRVP
ncbi:MAG TPA: Rrf2 family transcriptional regulator [Polyangiaceae bacterium]|nr:Rrf2 family transcriptional regulator [Polyangiaceae bacterium]